jgi:hypothetical protein
MQLTGAVVLVTGASAGIGRVAAARFAAKGARVLVHGRDRVRTQQVADEVGGRALVADLAAPADRETLAGEALDVFGRVDVLVNNAGFGYLGPVAAMGVDVIRRLIEVDLLAAVELTRSLLPGMLEQRRGATSASSCPAWSTRGSSRPGAARTPARGHGRFRRRRSRTPSFAPSNVTAQRSGGHGGFESRRPCARWLPVRFADSRSGSGVSPARSDRPRTGTRCASSRCPATAETGRRDGTDGSTPARTDASRPSAPDSPTDLELLGHNRIRLVRRVGGAR